MHWGIHKEANATGKTSEICMAELERCQRESLGYLYVFLGSQKYFVHSPPKFPRRSLISWVLPAYMYQDGSCWKSMVNSSLIGGYWISTIRSTLIIGMRLLRPLVRVLLILKKQKAEIWL